MPFLAWLRLLAFPRHLADSNVGWDVNVNREGVAQRCRLWRGVHWNDRWKLFKFGHVLLTSDVLLLKLSLWCAASVSLAWGKFIACNGISGAHYFLATMNGTMPLAVPQIAVQLGLGLCVPEACVVKFWSVFGPSDRMFAGRFLTWSLPMSSKRRLFLRGIFSHTGIGRCLFMVWWYEMRKACGRDDVPAILNTTPLVPDLRGLTISNVQVADPVHGLVAPGIQCWLSVAVVITLLLMIGVSTALTWVAASRVRDWELQLAQAYAATKGSMLSNPPAPQDSTAGPARSSLLAQAACQGMTMAWCAWNAAPGFFTSRP